MVLHHIAHTPRPGFDCVATNIDTVNERHFLGRNVGNIDVDIENQIRDLLNDNPCGEIAAELLAIVDFAAAAIANLRTGRYLCLRISRYLNKLVSA